MLLKLTINTPVKTSPPRRNELQISKYEVPVILVQWRTIPVLERKKLLQVRLIFIHDIIDHEMAAKVYMA